MITFTVRMLGTLSCECWGRCLMKTSLLILLCSLVVGISTADASEKVPEKTSDFLVYCAQHKNVCEDYLNGRNLALVINAKQLGISYCSAENYNDAQALRDVERWLSRNSGTRDKATEKSVDAALQAVYPCKPSSTKFPGRVGEFLTYCKSHQQQCVDHIVDIMVAITMNDDAKFCLPDKQTDAQIGADPPAVIQWLASRADLSAMATSPAIRLAWENRYPCKQ